MRVLQQFIFAQERKHVMQRLRLHRAVWQANGGHCRYDLLVRLRRDVADHRPFGFECLDQCGVQTASVRARHIWNSEGVGDLVQRGNRDPALAAGADIMTSEKALLRIADRGIAIVTDDKQLHVEAVMAEGLHFL